MLFFCLKWFRWQFSKKVSIKDEERAHSWDLTGRHHWLRR
jgi:hypothetical protein